MLDQETLMDLVSYDRETGVFTWKKPRRGCTPGNVVGAKSDRGYIFITINYKSYGAHRLAWLYVHGCFPPQYVDHINRDKSDNRICNLRLADNSQNQNNRGGALPLNTSGFRGVSYSTARKLFIATIHVRGKTIQLGAFPEAAEAGRAVDVARLKYFGEYAGVLNSGVEANHAALPV